MPRSWRKPSIPPDEEQGWTSEWKDPIRNTLSTDPPADRPVVERPLPCRRHPASATVTAIFFAPTAGPPRQSRRPPLLRLLGPGLLVSVGYMDPGNWATDIEAGSRFGYALLFVVLVSGAAAMLLQSLCARLGIVTGQDLAQVTARRYGRPGRLTLWLVAELAIIATDMAEVLGSALAIHLLFGLPLWIGTLITGLDTLVVLGLGTTRLRRTEAAVLGLVGTITVCFALQLAFVRPDGAAIVSGLLPSPTLLDEAALPVAIAIVGATVMPHNLYLHSAMICSRLGEFRALGTLRAIRIATADVIGSLSIATIVNAAILVLAAATFHASGYRGVGDIADAYELLAPLTGSQLAATLFAVALLASGQSATFTGTIAGQVVLEGFTRWRMPDWQRRAITRGIAILPAVAGLCWLGETALGPLLVATQILLSLALPFTLWPLLRASSDRTLMGDHANGPGVRAIGWLLFAILAACDLWLIRAVLG